MHVFYIGRPVVRTGHVTTSHCLNFSNGWITKFSYPWCSAIVFFSIDIILKCLIKFNLKPYFLGETTVFPAHKLVHAQAASVASFPWHLTISSCSWGSDSQDMAFNACGLRWGPTSFTDFTVLLRSPADIVSRLFMALVRVKSPKKGSRVFRRRPASFPACANIQVT